MDKKPKYIIVTKGAKKQAVTPTKKAKPTVIAAPKKPEEKPMPQALKEYVAHAFANCLPAKKTLLETQLKSIITQAQRTNMIDMIDWNERDLPSACEDTNNPNATSLYHKQTVAASIKSKMGDIKLTPLEAKKRQLRAMRFQNDMPAVTPPPPTQPVITKKKKKFTPITWDTEVAAAAAAADRNQVIVGTSVELEKPYFRLTSAADPATVRPLNILKRAFKMLKSKWKEEGNYSYICEQFKSMRQDLTVQRIQNEFTVKVYEMHARIALEKGDIGEYNQCQTQLKYLYEKNISGCENEFLAYRILYLIFSQNQSDINAMLEEICEDGINQHVDCVQHALMIRSCLAKGNYHKFFTLYENAPNMGGYLLDQFVGRIRVDALIVMCKAYKMGVSVSFIAKELAFDNIRLLVKFLRQHGITQLIKNKDAILDTKTTLPILLAQSKTTYNKVDIKGQI